MSNHFVQVAKKIFICEINYLGLSWEGRNTLFEILKRKINNIHSIQKYQNHPGLFNKIETPKFNKFFPLFIPAGKDKMAF
jgi:hypothetical protein